MSQSFSEEKAFVAATLFKGDLTQLHDDHIHHWNDQVFCCTYNNCYFWFGERKIELYRDATIPRYSNERTLIAHSDASRSSIKRQEHILEIIDYTKTVDLPNRRIYFQKLLLTLKDKLPPWEHQHVRLDYGDGKILWRHHSIQISSQQEKIRCNIDDDRPSTYEIFEGDEIAESIDWLIQKAQEGTLPSLLNTLDTLL